jgi:hypothetical protein
MLNIKTAEKMHMKIVIDSKYIVWTVCNVYFWNQKFFVPKRKKQDGEKSAKVLEERRKSSKLGSAVHAFRPTYVCYIYFP